MKRISHLRNLTRIPELGWIRVRVSFLTEIIYHNGEACNGRSVKVPNFDGTYVSVPNFFGIHNISFFKFLPDLKYLT